MSSPLTRRRLLGAGAATAAGLVLGACNLDRASSPDRVTDPDAGWAGTYLPKPLEKPDVVLEDLDGKPFDLRTDTAGKLTLLFFGYTNCPDQCPIYLSSLQGAREAIGSGPGSRPQVLFVGVDTKRDTPKVLKDYLGRIDPTFTGLTGTPEKIDEASQSLGFGGIEFGEPDADGNYLVVHYGRAVAFTPDDLGHRLYGFDTRQEDFKKDLPRLAEGRFK